MIEPEGGSATAASPSPEVAALGAGRKLLLVDDDAPLRRSLARALERRNFIERGIECPNRYNRRHAAQDS